MANPTTYYNFVLPTSSDLVTDLPADFDIALQGVDTRLKALQPGTTLGDVAYSSATANTNTRLGIGSTGQVLTVAGGVPTWATLTTPTYTWATYTPTNSGITVGNGTQTARFVKIGKTVFVSYKFVLGSTSSVTGGVAVGLPSENVSFANCSVGITDAGASNYWGTGVADPGQGSVTMRAIGTGSTFAFNNDGITSIFTWTTNDVLQFFMTYEEA